MEVLAAILGALVLFLWNQNRAIKNSIKSSKRLADEFSKIEEINDGKNLSDLVDAAYARDKRDSE